MISSVWHIPENLIGYFVMSSIESAKLDFPCVAGKVPIRLTRHIKNGDCSFLLRDVKYKKGFQSFSSLWQFFSVLTR